MRIITRCIVCIAFGLFMVEEGQAETPSVTIHSPTDGAVLDIMEMQSIDYEVVPGPHGDHVHIYVDGKEVAILRSLKGKYTLASLAEGERELCIKVVNRNHTPIGVNGCVHLTVE